MKGKKTYSNYLVRTDPQTRKITTMFASEAAQSSVPETMATEDEYEIVEKDRVPVKLASIRELREEVMDVAHNGISLNEIDVRIDRVICESHFCRNRGFMETIGCYTAWRQVVPRRLWRCRVSLTPV
jgi:hypothetical protein